MIEVVDSAPPATPTQGGSYLATVPKPGPDNIGFSSYFEDLFVPENKIDVEITAAHRDICDVLEAGYLGLLPQQFIWLTMPPRTGKTTIMQALTSWAMGYFPTSQIILTGYSDAIATASLGRVADTMRELWYQEYFGDLVHGDRVDHLSTIFGGNVFAEGVRGSLLGRGAGLKSAAGGFIGVDDPAKPEDVLSINLAKKLEMWVESPLLHRRNSDRWCPIIGIAQRLGLTDLVEYFKRTYPEETLILKYPGFKDGKSLFPSTFQDKKWETGQRTRVGRWVLASVYQQEPTSLGGNMIPVDKFARHSDYHLPFDEKILVCDTALKKGEGNDWWVIQAWGRSGGKCYLLDSTRSQCNSAEFIRIAATFYQKHMAEQEHFPVSRFIIEDSAAGPGVLSALNEAGIPATPIIPVKDKAARIGDILPYIETGMILIPTDDDERAKPWLPDFLAEATAFKQDLSHEHDDQCLIAGTLIRTRHGLVEIERIRPGYEVATRTGWKVVIWAGQTGMASSIVKVETESGNKIIGTGAHPVWSVSQGRFVRLDSLVYGDIVLECQNTPPIPSKQLSSMESNSVDTQNLRRETIGAISLQDTPILKEARAACISKYGNRFMVLSPKARSFITSMETHSITKLQTWKQLPIKNTWLYTGSAGIGIRTRISKSNISRASVLKRRNGIAQLKEESGTKNTPRNPLELLSPDIFSAKNAGMVSWPKIEGQNSVHPNALAETLGIIQNITLPGVAPIAVKSTRFIELNPTVKKGNSAQENVRDWRVPVFNLKVEGNPEFFANGILVHNCDCLAYAISTLMGEGVSILQALGDIR